MKLNPEMLALAREYRQLTQEQLAQQLSCSQARIAKLENAGGPDVTAGEATVLASKLAFPVDFFLQDEVRVGFGSSSYYHRKKSGLSAADRKRIQSLVNIIRIHLKRMLTAVDVQTTRQLRQLDLEDYSGRPELVAGAIRDFWRLPAGPIKDMTVLLEGAGVIVIPCSFGTKDMDGTSLWLGELPPLIFINKALPGDRWRFTLAHELGHLIMHDLPTETMEREADAFAAELLMPTAEIRAQFSRMRTVNLESLANMKPYWKVAISALLRRARDLGYVNDNAARYQYQRLSKMGYRLQEPVEIQRENPQTIRDLFTCFLEKMNYTAASLADYLRAPTGELESIYGVDLRGTTPRPQLRLVK